MQKDTRAVLMEMNQIIDHLDQALKTKILADDEVETARRLLQWREAAIITTPREDGNPLLDGKNEQLRAAQLIRALAGDEDHCRILSTLRAKQMHLAMAERDVEIQRLRAGFARAKARVLAAQLVADDWED